MVIFLPSSLESCGGQGISSKEKEEVCLSSPKNETSMAMVMLLPSLGLEGQTSSSLEDMP